MILPIERPKLVCDNQLAEKGSRKKKRRDPMKRSQKHLVVVLSCLMVAAFLMATSAFAVTLKGEINDQGQFVAKDGTVYNIAVAKDVKMKGKPTVGKSLKEEVGKKVQVKGNVTESGGQKTINVSSYYVY
jgi:hypothetical protein